MFRRLPDVPAAAVAITIDGVPHVAREGDSVAAALLAAGHAAFRATPVRGEARGPYCLMGVCFDCLVTIDGRPAQQSCAIAVVQGMRVETTFPRRES
jgi:predicted molibdopterin-dependent oxidoreductase YjgC